MQIMVHK